MAELCVKKYFADPDSADEDDVDDFDMLVEAYYIEEEVRDGFSIMVSKTIVLC